MDIHAYAEAIDEAATSLEDLDGFEALYAAREDAAVETKAIAALGETGPMRALVELWERARDAADDGDRMRAAFARELSDRGFWSATQRAFALVREHVARPERSVPRATDDAEMVAAVIALARRAPAIDDDIAALGTEAVTLVRTAEGRARALQLLEDARLAAGDDALGVIRVSLIEAQLCEALGEPARARRIYREIIQFGREVDGAGVSIGWAAHYLGWLEAELGHDVRAGRHRALAQQIGEATGIAALGAHR